MTKHVQGCLGFALCNVEREPCVQGSLRKIAKSGGIATDSRRLRFIDHIWHGKEKYGKTEEIETN